MCAEVYEARDPSENARSRMFSHRGEPLFIADWDRVLMLHFEVEPGALQRVVPFQLDLRDERAFVSLVAFTLRGMRPRVGGKFAAWLFRPIATHEFLNVRTYVRHEGEPGIHFLAEWLSNRIAVALGPKTFGLPYRFGRICYEHNWETGRIRGSVRDISNGVDFAYSATLNAAQPFSLCECGSLDEWLMERFTAFNSVGNRRKFFRVWHAPWKQVHVDARIISSSLLTGNWSWFKEARLCGGNFSPAARDVWIGRPHRIPDAITPEDCGFARKAISPFASTNQRTLSSSASRRR